MKIFILLIFIFKTFNLMATNYYVSPNGNDDNDGLTINTAFQTIERSTYAVLPGDTVFIRNGIYTKNYPESLIAYLTVSGTENNPITFRNFPNETPILQMNATNWAAISINGNDYIIIDGLTIIGNNDNITLAYAQEQQLNIGNPATSGNGIAINAEYNNESNKPHHNIIRNCKISKCGGGGIYTYNADYTTIENNIVSQCGWYAPYGNSGISMYQNWNSDSNIGIKNYITGNTCFRNENFIPFYVVGSITDGNGIIIDDGRNTQNNSTLGIYNGYTYIANNLVFDNGGRGIHCFESDNVLIVNNTVYQNCKSQFTQEGEMTAFDASNITYYNNIVSPSNNIPPIFAYTPSTSNIVSQFNLITNNYNLANPVGSNNIIGNANFINPTINFETANFRLQSTSLALNNGTTTNAPITDKDGNIRLINGFIDIGCYEFQNILTTNESIFNNIKIIPNPAKNYFSVDFSDKVFENTNLSIYDLSGKLVKEISVENDNQQIDIKNLETGIYIVIIEFLNETFSTKLIVN